MKDIYSHSDSEYLHKTKTWHVEDSPWKARQIFDIIKANDLHPTSVVEVGCGVGEILYQMHELSDDKAIQYVGYDIAEEAIKRAREREVSNINFYKEDFTTVDTQRYDLLLMIDVFEHIPDYIGFLEKCRDRAEYKIFHIPLDIHLSSLLRNKMISLREGLGHLHYFTKDTAIVTLKDTGYEIMDWRYTDLSVQSKQFKSKVASIPRKLLFPIFSDFTVKLLGGYSLLVLAK